MAEGDRIRMTGGDALAKLVAGKADAAAVEDVKHDVSVASKEVRHQTGQLEVAQNQLGRLEKDLEAATKARKRLSDAQRKLLDEIALFDESGMVRGAGGGDGRTYAALDRRGLVERRGGRTFLSEAGRALDTRGIVDDITSERQHVAQLTRQIEQGVRATEQAEQQVTAAVERGEERKAAVRRQGAQRRAAARKTSLPAPRDLTREQDVLMRQYVEAEARGAQEAEALRKKLVAQKVLGPDQVGAATRGPVPTFGRASKPSFNTDAYRRQFAEAMQAPGFQFTPDPRRLAMEIARRAGGVDYFPDELKGLPTKKAERSQHMNRELAVREFMAPHADAALAALPTDVRARLEKAATELRSAREALTAAQQSPGGATKPGQFNAVQKAESALLNLAREAQGLAAQEQQRSKITYNPAFLREKEQEAKRAAEAAKASPEPARSTVTLAQLEGELAKTHFEAVSTSASGHRGGFDTTGKKLAQTIRRAMAGEIQGFQGIELNATGRSPNRQEFAGAVELPKQARVAYDAIADQIRKLEGFLTYHSATPEQLNTFERLAQQHADRLPAHLGNYQNSPAEAVRNAVEHVRQAYATSGATEPGEALFEAMRRQQRTGWTFGHQRDPNAAAERLPEIDRALDETLDRRVQAHRARQAGTLSVKAYKKELEEIRQAEERLEGDRRALGRPVSRGMELTALGVDANAQQTERARQVLAESNLKPADVTPYSGEVAAVQKAEQAKTKAVEEGATKRKRARSQEGAAISGDAEAFEREVADIAQAARQNRQILAAANVQPVTVDPGEAAAIRERRLSPDGGIVPHPELFGQRQPGPFGQVFRPAGVTSEPSQAVQRTYSQLDNALREELLSEQELSAANRKLRHSKTNADRYTLEELRTIRSNAESAKARNAAAQGWVAAARADMEAMRAAAAATRTRAAAEEAVAAEQRTALAQRAAAEHGAAQRRLGPGRTGGGQLPPPGGQLDRVRSGTELVHIPGRGQTFIGSTAEEIPGDERATLTGNVSNRARAARGPIDPAGLAAVTASAQEYARQQDVFQRLTGRGATEAMQMGRSLQFLARQNALGGDQMHRHGLLTVEFLDALRAGRVTIREIGTQLGGTILKFGGWTAAATATYGAAAALGAVGSGAIDSLEGVNALQRVLGTGFNTDRAQRDFRDLSRQFNLPVGQVTGAAYEAAKAFKDQGDAMVATKAALYGVKIGEIDAADAGRLVTAVTRGFHLQARELIPVMNTVNNLQNRLGANFGQVAQGVASAAGSFGAAGGTYQQAAALITTGMLTTGRTGQEIGTALRRTAEITRRPNRRELIQSVLGVDPQHASITELLQEGQRRVARGADPFRIASALTTPELASRGIVAILQNQKLYQRALSAAQNPGQSAQTELERRLGSIKERISSITNDLQRMGASLAQSGALNVFGVFLGVLDKTLSTVNLLLDGLNALPAPLRSSVVAAGELVGTLALMRRFDAGTLFPEGSRLNRQLSRNPAQRLRAEVLQGLVDESGMVVQERQAAGRRANTAVSRYSTLGGQARQNQLAENLLPIYSAQTTSDRRAAIERVAQLRGVGLDQIQGEITELERLRRAQQAALVAEAEVATLREEYARVQQQTANFTKRSTRRALGAATVADVERVAVAEGILYGSSTLPRPNSLEPTALGGERRTAGGIAGPPGAAMNAAAGVVETEAVLASHGITTAEGRVGGSIRRFGGRIGNLGRSLVSGLGGLNLALIGLPFAIAGIGAVIGAIKRSHEEAERVKNLVFQRDAQGALDELNQRDAQPSYRGVPTGRAGPGPQAAQPRQQTEEDRERAQLERVVALQKSGTGGFRLPEVMRQLRRNIGLGDPNAFRTAREQALHARGLIDAQFALRRARRGGDADEISAAENHLNDVRAGINRFLADDVADVRRQTKAIQRGTYNRGISLQQLGQINNLRLFEFGPTRRTVRGTARVLGSNLLDVINQPDPATQQQLIEQYTSDQQQVIEPLQKRYEQLARNASPTRMRSLQRNFTRDLRRLQVGPVRDALKHTQRELTSGQGDVDDRQALIDRMPDGPGLQNALRGLEKLRDQARLTRHNRDRLRGMLHNANQLVRDATQQLASGFVDDRLERIDSHFELVESRTTDPVTQAREEVQHASRRLDVIRAAVHDGSKTQADLEKAQADYNTKLHAVADAIFSDLQDTQQVAVGRFQATHPGDAAGLANLQRQQANQLLAEAQTSAQRRTGLQALYSAMDAQRQAAEAVFEANQGLASARFAGSHIGDQGAILRKAASDAHDVVAHLRSQGVSGADLINAMKGAQEADNAVAEYVQQQAQALVQARGELQQSLTDNPVTQARDQLHTDQQLLKFAKTPADRLSALAKINNDRRAVINARSSRQLEDINYEHDIGKLTDQAWIAAMQRVLRTLKKGSEARRQLRMEIGRAKHDIEAENDSELELNVGDIRLPSVYEVRRLASQGLAAPAVVNQSNVVNVNGAQNPEELGRQFAGILRTANRASMRAAGMRG